MGLFESFAKIPGWQATENLIYANTHGGTVNLAVTGLSRAGKTVFITSMLANLLAAGAPMPTVRAQKRLKGLAVAEEGRIKSASIIRTSPTGPAKFPFAANAKALSSTSPHWPSRTAAVSEISVEIEFWGDEKQPNHSEPVNPGKFAKLLLNILDYPGEWLVDLPILGQTYDEWSKQSLQLLQEKPRDILSKEWQNWASNHTNGIYSEEEAKCGALLWQEYLCDCRQANLCFLQPSRFIRSEGDTDDFSKPELDDSLTFFPMEKPPGQIKWTNQYFSLEKRFNNYRDTIVAEFYRDILSKYTRQIVLVDVLGALNGGEEVYNDTRRALMAINKILTDKSSDWFSRLKKLKLNSLIDRLVFVVTKADHLPEAFHGSLQYQLGAMLYDEERKFDKAAKSYNYMMVASIQCTREQIDDADTIILGYVEGDNKPVKFRSPAIPSTHPEHEWWSKQTAGGRKPFNIPSFQPPKIEDYKSHGIPCRYLGKVLEELLGDKLK